MSQAPVVGSTHRGPHSSPSSLGSTISSLGRPVQRAEGEGRSHPRCLGGGCPPMEVLSSDSATPMSRPHWARAGFQALGVAAGVGEGTGFQRPGGGEASAAHGPVQEAKGVDSPAHSRQLLLGGSFQSQETLEHHPGPRDNDWRCAGDSGRAGGTERDTKKAGAISRHSRRQLGAGPSIC